MRRSLKTLKASQRLLFVSSPGREFFDFVVDLISTQGVDVVIEGFLRNAKNGINKPPPNGPVAQPGS